MIKMEEDKNESKIFLQILESTLLSILLIMIIGLFVTYQNNLSLPFNSALIGLLIMYLFYSFIPIFIFSGIFYYINKNFPMLLYLILFFFSLWATIFIISNSGGRKYDNKIPDIMDGLSEYITIKLIQIIFILLISNFIIVLKNSYIAKKSEVLEN